MITIKPTLQPKFYKIRNANWRPIMVSSINCPTCGIDKIKKSSKKWIGRCQTCGHIHSFLFPIPAQSIIMQMRSKIFNLVGGTGSGKTTASSSIISDTMRMKPGVKVVAFAQTEDQLNNTGKEELIKFFYKDEFKTFNQDSWILNNGSRIEWYTSKSEQKVRGMNMGIAWLIESSGIKHEIFKQLMTRTRQDELKNVAYDEDGNILYEYNEKNKRYEMVVLSEIGMLINETNPTYEWPRDKAVFKSHTVMYTESVRGVEDLYGFVKSTEDPENPGVILDMVSILFASPDNPNMTEEYMSSIRMTYDDKAEYNRDIYCDMSYSQGLIYGKWKDSMFVSGFPSDIPSNKISIGESMDPGGASKGNDETAYGLFKIVQSNDPEELPDIYLVDGYKISGLSTAEEAAHIWEVRNRNNWQNFNHENFTVDPHGVKNEKKTKSNLIKDLKIWNIYMSSEGVSDDPDWGIKRIIDFLKAGKFHIVDNEFGKMIRDEIATYMWTKKMTRSRDGHMVQKPYDRNNHALDMIRFKVVKVSVTPQALMRVGGGMVKMGKKRGANSINPYDWETEDSKKTNWDKNGQGGIYYKV